MYANQRGTQAYSTEVIKVMQSVLGRVRNGDATGERVLSRDKRRRESIG